VNATTEGKARLSAAIRPPQPLWKHRAFIFTLVCFAGAALSSTFFWTSLETRIYEVEFQLAEAIDFGSDTTSGAARFFVLPLLGFLGGLLASISPCVLPLVPVNVAYIGAQDAGRWRSVALSLQFSIGAAVALSTLGLMGDLAGFLLIEQRGIVLLCSGLALIYFGFVIVEIAPNPIAGRDLLGAQRFGPFGAGAAFSLVTTPCTSPLLGAVMVATAAHPAPGVGVMTMIAFSFGYTLLVFLGGVFGGGLATWARRIDLAAPRAVAGAILLGAGITFAWSGLTWF
jgi:cytochrome c-type biogenesis protein